MTDGLHLERLLLAVIVCLCVLCGWQQQGAESASTGCLRIGTWFCFRSEVEPSLDDASGHGLVLLAHDKVGVLYAPADLEPLHSESGLGPGLQQRDPSPPIGRDRLEFLSPTRAGFADLGRIVARLRPFSDLRGRPPAS